MTPRPRHTAPDHAEAARSPRRQGTKLAEQVALRIEDDIRAAGWPIGSNLGSESDLLVRYGVSRAVLREAVSLTEYLGVARMRRGPGGGFFVREPDQSAVVTAVTVYLASRAVTLADIVQARRPVEELAARLAAERLTPGDRDRLNARVTQEQTRADGEPWVLHGLIARATGNPALEVIVQILSRITVQQPRPDSRSRRDAGARSEVAAAHRSIATSITSGDSERVGAQMLRHMDALHARLGDQRFSHTVLFGDSRVDTEGRKLAGSVARRLFTDVVEMGWPVGHLLGSEAELIDRYDCSRAVLREANRLLEFHRVVRTQRGVGGGIFVSDPDEMATADALAVYLDSRRVSSQHLFEVREAIELANVDLAASRLDKSAIGALTETLVEEMGAPAVYIGSSAHALHLRIAQLTGNQAISLFLHALTRLTEHHTVSPSEGFPMSYEDAAASVARAHASIVQAIAAGDAEAAKRRMQRHLRAVPPLLR